MTGGADISPFAQFGVVGLIVGLLLSVFAYALKRMLDHLLTQHAAYSAEKFEDMKRSIASFGERLGAMEQEMAAWRAVQEYSRPHVITKHPGDAKK